MLIAKSIRLSGVHGRFDPTVLSVGDLYLDEFRHETAEIIKISQYGVKIRYPDGDTRTFSTPDLYAHPQYTFIISPKQHDFSELGEEADKAFKAGIPEEQVGDPYLLRHWVYIRSNETIGVIEGVDYRSQPVTLFVRVFPNGPLDYTGSMVVTVPVTEAELMQNFDLYSPEPSFATPFQASEIPELTGIYTPSSFSWGLEAGTQAFKHLPVYLPRFRDIGFVQKSGLSAGTVDVVRTGGKPLSMVPRQKKPETTNLSRGEVVPLRDHRLLSSLYSPAAYPLALAMLGKICSRNWRYPTE